MKTLIAVAVLATSALSFSANATPSSTTNNLIEAAQSYLNDKGEYLNQGYFMGMVQFYGDSVENCVPDGIKYRIINQRVARVITFDSKVLSMSSPYEVMDYAFSKAFPCIKS